MKTLLLSDIHGNIEALNRVMYDSIRKYDEVLILGDLVDYGVDTIAVFDRIKKIATRYPVYIIPGNHDSLALEGIRSYYQPKSLRGIKSNEITMKIGRDKIKELYQDLSNTDNVHFNLYDEISYYHGCICIHDEKRLVNKSVYEKIESICDVDTGLTVLAGHNHLPYDKIKDIRGYRFRVINPGSVGQPRDGKCEASYSILTIHDSVNELCKIVNVENYRVSYDNDLTSNKIRDAGGDQFIYNRIRLGI